MPIWDRLRALHPGGIDHVAQHGSARDQPLDGKAAGLCGAMAIESALLLQAIRFRDLLVGLAQIGDKVVEGQL